MTNYSYINVVDRCAEMENYCIYIILDSDLLHSGQLQAASFDSFVSKLYQKRTLYPLIKSMARS